MNRKPKKSEAITVSNFTVTTQWVSVEINVSNLIHKALSRVPRGLLREASDAVENLMIHVSMYADERPDMKPEEIIRAMGKPLVFLGHHPGQKLMPLEIRMEAANWERLKAAAAALDVSVVEFCREAFHQRSMRFAAFYRSRSEKREGRAA
jgi:hypothetical protein